MKRPPARYVPGLLARYGPGIAAAAVLLWLVGYPLLLTLLEALGLSGAGSGWTLAHFADFASRGEEWLALWRSLWISAASVALAALVGVPLAFLFERADFPGRRTLGALVVLPVALPPLVGVIAFLFLWGESGFASRLVQAALGLEHPPWRLLGPVAVLLVHGYSTFVFFYLFVRAALARLDGAMLEAAAALGAGRTRTFFRVVLPQLRPALLGASLLTFMTSLGSFSAPFIFGRYQVMTIKIYNSRLNDRIAMAQVESLVLAAMALLGLVLIRRLQGPDAVASGHGVAPARRRAARPLARAALTVAATAAVAFLLLPHATLLLISLVPPYVWTVEPLPPALSFVHYRELFSELERLRPILSSLWMATVATAGAVALGLAAARQALRLGGRFGATLEGLVALPWAIPGTVFALALGTAFSVHQPYLGRFVLVNTAVILPLAYLVRCLPITGRAILAGLRQLDPALEEAAASLGAGRARAFVRVVLPPLRPALFAGLGLAFITALGDFVTSILLFTPDSPPISIAINEWLRVDFGTAAAYGVLLMVLSAAAFLAWGRGEEL